MSDNHNRDTVNLEERDALGIYGQPKKRKKRIGRWIFLFLLLTLVLVGIFLPAFLSSEMARQKILAIANEKYEGNIELGRLNVSWGGPCLLDKLLVKDSNGYELFKVDQIKTTVGLLHLLISRQDLGTFEVNSPDVYIRSESRGESSDKNKPASPVGTDSAEGTDWQAGLDKYHLRCMITDGRCRIESLGENSVVTESTRLEDLNATLELKEGNLLSEIAGKLDLAQPEKHISTGFKWNGTIGVGWKDIALKGQLELNDAVAQLDKKTIEQKRIILSCDGALNPVLNTVIVDSLELDSQLLTLDLAGKVEAAKNKIDLSLDGSYRSDWQEMEVILNTFAPDLAKNIQFLGSSQGDISLVGPINLAEEKADLSHLTARMGLGWDSASIYGQQAGRLELFPMLDNNSILIRPATVKVNDGVLQLAGMVDMSKTPSAFRLDQPLFVLQNYPLNYELSWKLLSYINPLFTQVAEIGGKVNLRVNNIFVPFNDKILQALATSGQLSLDNLQIVPKGLLLEILNLTGVDSLKEINIDPLAFQVTDGKVNYDNMAVHLNKDIQLKFSGSVGLDDKIDLKMAMPVTEGLLRRMGIKGEYREYLTALQQTDIVIPVRGTRKEPKLDLAAINIQKLIEQTGRSIIQKQSDQLIRDIIRKNLPDDLKQDKAQDGTKESDKTKPSSGQSSDDSSNKDQKPAKVEDVVIDILYDFLKKK